MSASMSAMILQELARNDINAVLDWEEDLVDAIKQNQQLIVLVAPIFGMFGRTSLENAKKFIKFISDELKRNHSDSTALMMFCQSAQSIAEYNKDVAVEYQAQFKVCKREREREREKRTVSSISLILALPQELTTNADANVRMRAQMIVDLLEGRDLSSVNKKVDTVEVKVEKQQEQINVVLSRFD
jgi:hypothetical protein